MDNLRCISDNLTQTDDRADDPAVEPVGRPVGRRGLLRIGTSAALIGAAAAIVESSPAGAAARPGLHAATNASRAIDARQDGSGDAIYSHIENAEQPEPCRVRPNGRHGDRGRRVRSRTSTATPRPPRESRSAPGPASKARAGWASAESSPVRPHRSNSCRRWRAGTRGGARRANSSSTTRTDSGSVAAAPTGSNWPSPSRRSGCDGRDGEVGDEDAIAAGGLGIAGAPGRRWRRSRRTRLRGSVEATPKVTVNGGTRPDAERECEAFAHSFEHSDRDVGAAVRQHDHEFLAAVPGDDVVGAHRVAQHPRERAQRLVADVVAVRVVEDP